MNLSNKQKEIVFSTERNIVVIASAAAGKTACLAERVRHLLNKGANPERMVLMTFTNTAAEEMSQRIGAHEGMYIGTIHGYANQLLLRSGIDTSGLISSENFDELFEMALDNPSCAKKIDYLLIDEAQDLTELEYQFVFDILKPKSFFAVGDARQSIYGFRSARPDLFLSLSDRGDTVTYSLNENYRNGSIILNFAKRIIDKVGFRYIDNSIPMVSRSGKVVERDYNLNEISNLIYEKRETVPYKDWFILARYNSHVEEVYNHLARKGIPCETFKRADMNNAEMAVALNNNTVKVMTIHAAKGLEAKNVMVIGAKYYSDEEKRISYVAATRAKNNLIWYKIPNKKDFKKKIQSWE
jgi:superfamily I DNA/RNA helicase